MFADPHSYHDNATSSTSPAQTSFTPSTDLPDPQHYRPILAAALRMADKAVSLDSAKNYDVAIVAYSDTLKLIECILERPGMDAVRDRLIGTYVSYSSRIAKLQQLDLHPIPQSLKPRHPEGFGDIEEEDKEEYDDADTIGIAVSEHSSYVSLQEDTLTDEAQDEAEPLADITSKRLNTQPTIPRGHASRDSEAIVWFDFGHGSSSSSRSSQISQRSLDHDLDEPPYFETDRETYSSESDTEEFEAAMSAAVEFAYQNDIVVEENENEDLIEDGNDTIYLSGDSHQSATLDELCQKTRRRPPPPPPPHSNNGFLSPTRGSEKADNTLSRASMRDGPTDAGESPDFSLNSLGIRKGDQQLHSDAVGNTQSRFFSFGPSSGSRAASSGSWLNSWVTKSLPKIGNRRPA